MGTHSHSQGQELDRPRCKFQTVSCLQMDEWAGLEYFTAERGNHLTHAMIVLTALGAGDER